MSRRNTVFAKSQGVGPSAVKSLTGLQSVLQVQGVGEVSEFFVRPQSLQKVVFPHHGEFQAAGAEVGLFLLRQEVQFGHGLSGDGVLGRGAVAGVTDGACVPETAVVFERFVLLLVVAVHPVGSELLFAAVGQGVLQVGQSPFQGRPLQPQDAVLGKLTAGHVALRGDGGHGGGEEGFGGHVVFGPSVRQGPTSVPEGGQVSTSVGASHGPGLRQELGLEHLVGHGSHGQTGEGVHAGGLEHQTPVLQTGFFSGRRRRCRSRPPTPSGSQIGGCGRRRANPERRRGPRESCGRRRRRRDPGGGPRSSRSEVRWPGGESVPCDTPSGRRPWAGRPTS